MGTGADTAIEASDLTLVRGDLRAVPDAIRLSRRTLRTIKGNLDGLGQLIHLGLMLGGLRAVRSTHQMTAAPDGRPEPSVVAAVPGALRWRGPGGRGTRVGRDYQGWRELSERKACFDDPKMRG
jgi:hypothetical protein